MIHVGSLGPTFYLTGEPDMNPTVYELIRLRHTLAATGDSRSGIYEKIKRGTFVPPVKIGRRAVAWPAYEVAAINAARIAGRSDAELKALVARLCADRRLAK